MTSIENSTPAAQCRYWYSQYMYYEAADRGYNHAESMNARSKYREASEKCRELGINPFADIKGSVPFEWENA